MVKNKLRLKLGNFFWSLHETIHGSGKSVRTEKNRHFDGCYTAAGVIPYRWDNRAAATLTSLLREV